MYFHERRLPIGHPGAEVVLVCRPLCSVQRKLRANPTGGWSSRNCGEAEKGIPGLVRC